MSTRHLPNKFTTPPGGWRYRVPETGQVFSEVSEHALLAKLTAHYKASGYRVPDDLSQRIEHFICEAIPEYCDGDAPVRGPSLANTFHTVLQGTRTLFHWWLQGKKVVDEAQANARAAVCASCPRNEEPQGCTSCNSATLREAVEQIVGNRQTAFHHQLRACNVCLCNLRAKVWLPHSVLWRNMPADQRERLPEHCWLKKEEQQPAHNP